MNSVWESTRFDGKRQCRTARRLGATVGAVMVTFPPLEQVSPVAAVSVSVQR
jgi:hypothetical protein